jgi:hypothetical protein
VQIEPFASINVSTRDSRKSVLNLGWGTFAMTWATSRFASFQCFRISSFTGPDTIPVQILRVIHGARDLPRVFEEDA